MDLNLAQRVSAPAGDPLENLIAMARTPLRYRSKDAERLLVPAQPEHSVLFYRLSSANPQTRMPPLGSVVPDPAGMASIGRWLRQMPALPEPPQHEGDKR